MQAVGTAQKGQDNIHFKGRRMGNKGFSEVDWMALNVANNEKASQVLQKFLGGLEEERNLPIFRWVG